MANDDDDDDDADLVDLSGLDKSGEQEQSSAEKDAQDMREQGGAGAGEGIEALLEKFLQRQDEPLSEKVQERLLRYGRALELLRGDTCLHRCTVRILCGVVPAAEIARGG